MTPPKATPNRKGKVCKPIVYSTDMPRIGQSILAEIHINESVISLKESIKDLPDDMQEFINEKYWDLL